VPKEGYWQRIREICDAYHVKLIADEVMTGCGRCGHNFCLDHWRVTPDLIITAKGLSSGYTPLGALIAMEEIHEAIRSGSGAFVHGHTYSQNPLSTAIGATVLRYIEEHELVERSKRIGRYLLERLLGLLHLEMVGDVRGLGHFAGVELVNDRSTRATFDPKLKVNVRVASEAFKRGLITYPGGGGADGINGDHILLAPPFIITEAQIDELVGILEESIEAVQKSL
jgi:adenosylmethionine-8-amino-7-oxononanoate aminotransferase